MREEIRNFIIVRKGSDGEVLGFDAAKGASIYSAANSAIRYLRLHKLTGEYTLKFYDNELAVSVNSLVSDVVGAYFDSQASVYIE